MKTTSNLLIGGGLLYAFSKRKAIVNPGTNPGTDGPVIVSPAITRSTLLYEQSSEMQSVNKQNDILILDESLWYKNFSYSYLFLTLVVTNVVYLVQRFKISKAKPGSSLYSMLIGKLMSQIHLKEGSLTLSGFVFSNNGGVFSSEKAIALSEADLLILNKFAVFNKRTAQLRGTHHLAQNLAYCLTFRNIGPLGDALYSSDGVDYSDLSTIQTADFDPTMIFALTDDEASIIKILRKAKITIMVNPSTGEYMYYFSLTKLEKQALAKVVRDITPPTPKPAKVKT